MNNSEIQVTKKKKKINFNLWLSEEEHHELKTASDKTKIPMSAIIRDGSINRARELIEKLNS
jgi:hypothetical protein